MSLEDTLNNESIILQESAWGDIVPFSDYPNNDWNDIASGTMYGQAFTTINDRIDGKYFPIFQCEQDLAMIRAGVRRFIGMSEVVEAVHNTLKVYTFGKGIEWTVKPLVGKDTPERLVDDIKRIIDRFAENIALQNSFDHEMQTRAIDDGNTLIAIERDISNQNQIDANFVEPECLTQPRSAGNTEFMDYLEHQFGIDCSGFSPNWLFGILTRERQTSRPLGYHVVHNATGTDWDFYPTDQFVHLKRNVPRNVKIGLPDWFAVKQRVYQNEKLLTNMASAAALQSAIAWVEESPAGTTAGQLPGIGNLDGVYPKPTNIGNGGGTRTQKQTRYNAGTILRPTPGRQYKAGPMGSERNNGYIEVLKEIKRSTASRFVIPYGMISSDSSDTNYASSLVAEAPFVKARESDQEFYGNGIKSMLWKVVKLAWKLGWLDLRGIPISRLKEFVDIQLDFPSVATRDRTALVSQLVQEVDVLGVTSKRTAAIDLGRDYDEEVRNGAKAEMPAQVDGGGKLQLPNAQDGAEQNRQPPQQPIQQGQTGELSNASTLQFNRTTKAIGKILDGYKTGQSTRNHAKQLLLAVGTPEQRAEVFLSDADQQKQQKTIESIETKPLELDWDAIAKEEGWGGYP